jgi:oxygen-independent coproporphyrinogen-3 oxidase
MADHRVALTAAPLTAAPLGLVAGPPVALYVHVPFCVSICPYCDFVVYAGSAARGPTNRIATFLDALGAELELRADALDATFGPPGTPGTPGTPGRPPLASVYLGGGTPSLLPAAAVARLLARIRARFGLAAGAEVTLEANPGPDERGDAAAWRDAGVTRLSFGAQALDVDALRRLGRRHRPDDVADAIEAARAAGVESVSIDLLYDLPDRSPAAWEATLERALDLEPDHLSLYALTLDDPDAEGLTGTLGDHLPVSDGARRWRRRAAAGQDEERAATEYAAAVERLAGAGFRGYEISNWARAGHESRHNLAYWRRQPYEALGPGAHAYDGLHRRWTGARLDGYVAALRPADGSPPRLPPGGSETLDARTAHVESLVLGLRLDEGIALEDAGGPFAPAFAWAREAGLVTLAPADRLVLTTRGRLLSNELFARLV